jgi:hypothetical protein
MQNLAFISLWRQRFSSKATFSELSRKKTRFFEAPLNVAPSNFRSESKPLSVILNRIKRLVYFMRLIINEMPQLLTSPAMEVKEKNGKCVNSELNFGLLVDNSSRDYCNCGLCWSDGSNIHSSHKNHLQPVAHFYRFDHGVLLWDCDLCMSNLVDQSIEHVVCLHFPKLLVDVSGSQNDRMQFLSLFECNVILTESQVVLRGFGFIET